MGRELLVLRVLEFHWDDSESGARGGWERPRQRGRGGKGSEQQRSGGGEFRDPERGCFITWQPGRGDGRSGTNGPKEWPV